MGDALDNIRRGQYRKAVGDYMSGQLDAAGVASPALAFTPAWPAAFATDMASSLAERYQPSISSQIDSGDMSRAPSRQGTGTPLAARRPFDPRTLEDLPPGKQDELLRLLQELVARR